MTVLIAGAGIGGLTLGLSLFQAGIPFRIFESAPELRPLGVGINLQPHAVRELAELGLLDDLDPIGLRTREVAYVARNGKTVWSEPRGAEAGYRWPQFSIHRGKLQMLLHDRLTALAGGDVIRPGHAIVDWAEDGDDVVVTLEDRATGASLGTARGSLFIAADGIHSAARARLHPNEGPPVWGGTMMWRGVTRGPRFLTGRTMAMIGTKTCKFVCYPLADDGEDGSVINWIADLTLAPDTLTNRADWTRKGRLEDFLPEFEAFAFDWLDVPAIIRGAGDIYEYPMADRDPLPQWTHGRMTLLGDAAHAMYPIGSNGASQAIIDARVLVREILRHGETQAALQAYEAERRPVTTAIVLANRGDGPDAVLDAVEARAPNGFDRIEDVLSREELVATAATYKKLAGFDVEALNARAPILDLPPPV
ncbi:MAG: 2-polyprenyl-6-methoxyphenol hydroxylase-like FAD-dependent oxidoreductase [Paracoccaceae bacterium]|jgi:2-polyprenyl-6-methoxyphenol hydroxylase-like FAD-dependent oxidoreductase